tara:strand:+ start:102 stop:296 length:195 start_codon:yes stop_codon:yes gene_type:complete
MRPLILLVGLIFLAGAFIPDIVLNFAPEHNELVAEVYPPMAWMGFCIMSVGFITFGLFSKKDDY